MQIVKGLIGLPSRSKRVEEGEAIVVVFDSFLRERVCEDRKKKERKKIVSVKVLILNGNILILMLIN
jgi:hypothetical protein